MTVEGFLPSLFAAGDVVAHADRCLNHRHRAAACERCVTACPTSAITLHDGAPTVDPQACVHCGACLPSCPVDAITESDRPERRVLDACARLKAESVVLACAVHPGPRQGNRGPVVRTQRCLAALSTAQLLAISSHGARRVSLDLSWCGSCPIGSAAHTAAAAAAAARTLLQLLRGDEGDTIGVLVVAEGADAGPAVLVEAGQPQVTRRGLFESLRERADSAAQRAQRPPPPLARTRGGRVDQRLPQQVPASRRELLDELVVVRREAPERAIAEAAVAADQLPVAEVRVDADACTACGWCARWCPTGALRFVTEDDADHAGFRLMFEQQVCIDCGLCAVACEDTALSFGDTVVGAQFVHGARLVAAGSLAACNGCGVITAAPTGSGEARCSGCRHGSGVVSSQRDDAGLMADLLRREAALGSPGPDPAELAGRQ